MTRIGLRSILGATLVPLLAILHGCGGIAIIDESGGTTASGGGGGASTGTAGNGSGGATSSVGGAGGEAPGPLLTTCPGPELKPCMTDLYAATFAVQWGADAEFVGMEGSWVAGNRTPEPGKPGAFVLWLDDESGQLPPEVSEIPISPPPPALQRAVDVVETEDGAELLTCVDEICYLYTGSSDLGLLLNGMPYGEIPDARGLVLVGDDHRCVFGDGVACRNGQSWAVYVPPGTSPPFLAAASGRSDDGTITTWFVGQGGVIGRFTGTTWTNVDSPTTSTLRAVTATIGSEAIAAGDDGTVVILNDSGASASCTALGDDWLGVTRRYGDVPAHDDFALLSFGSWYVREAPTNQWCNYAVESDEPVAMQHRLCGSSTQWRILLESRVYVGKDCEP